MTVYILGAGASCCTDAYTEERDNPPLMGRFFGVVVERGLHKHFPGNLVNMILEPLGVTVEGLAKGSPAGANLETVVSLVELARQWVRESPESDDANTSPSQALRKMCEAMESQPIFGDDPVRTVRQVAESAVQSVTKGWENLKNEAMKPEPIFEGDPSATVPQVAQSAVQSVTEDRKNLINEGAAIAGVAYSRVGLAMRALREWIEAIYAPTDPYMHEEAKACSNYSSLFERLRPGDTVITLNYDFLLDRVLEERGNLRCRQGEPLPTVFDTGEGEGQYLKLHGSVLWGVEYSVEDWKRRGLAPEPLGKVCSQTFRDGVRQAGPGLGWKPSALWETLIVPPVVAKTFRPEIEKLWQQAEDALGKAEEIYVIGYSFPCTDRHVRKTTQSRLGGYDGVRVKIVTKEGNAKEREKLVERVKDGFPGAKVEIESNDGFDRWVKGEQPASPSEVGV